MPCLYTRFIICHNLFVHDREPRLLLPLPELLSLPLPDDSLGGVGTLAPSSLASDKPMAIACLGFVTFFPLLPLRNSPRFISCIFSLTSSVDFFEYLAII